MNDPHRIEATSPEQVVLTSQRRAASVACDDAVRDDRAAALQTDRDREAWLRGPVAESCDEYEADPEATIPAEQALVRASTAYSRHRISRKR